MEVLGALLEAPAAGGPELAGALRVSDAKAARYRDAILPVLEAAWAGRAVSGKAFDTMVGKVVYVACLSRFGRAETRPFYTQVGAIGAGTKRERRLRAVHTSAGLAECLAGWMQALAAPTAHGVTGQRRWNALPEAMALQFPHLLQRQDASGWGWGGRAGPRGVTCHRASLELVRAWTVEEREDLSITLRELLAAVELFEHAAPARAGQRVLVESDNTGAVAIINNGGSSVPAANDMVRRVAAACAQYDIEVRARHVPGTEMIHDGIDGLSRPGKGTPPSAPENRAVWEAGRRSPGTAGVLAEDEARALVEEDYKFLHFAMFNAHRRHTMDACCDERGFNAQPGCAHPFHAGRPVQGNWGELVGETVWVNPPFSLAEEVLEALMRAYMASPRTTRATVVLPVWETARWHRRYVAGGVLRLVWTYPEGSRLFNQPVRAGRLTRQRFNSGGTLWPVGVYRLGAWAGDPLLR